MSSIQGEAFFRALLDAVPDATLVADPAGAIVFANQRAESLFGYGAGELAGTPSGALIPEGQSRRGVRQDGTTFSAEVRSSEPDALPGMSVLSIRESAPGGQDDRRFRWVLESSPIGMAEIRFGGDVLKANDAFLALFGITRAGFEREGLNVNDYTPPELREATRENVDRCFRTRRPVLYEKEYLRRDGSRVPVVICLSWSEEASDEALAFALDLSAQKRIESELRISEERIRTLVESLPGMVFTADTSGGNTFTNHQYQQYTGVDAERLLGTGWLDVLHPEDRDRAAGTWDASVRTGAPYQAEYRFRRNDGVYRWHLCKGVPLHDRNGGIAVWFGNCTDIEDYKRAEAENRGIHQRLERIVLQRTSQLRESEEQYRALVEGVKDYAILMLDPQGRVASWNTCAERTKGYTAEEILGKHFSCFYPPEDIERGRPEEILRIVNRDGHYEEDGWRIRKDGSRFWANVAITVLRNEAGELRGYTKVTRDITDRMMAEERLRQSEQKFRAVLESAPDAVVIVAEDGRIELINAQVERLFGYQRAELIGQPVEILIPAGARTRHSRNLEDYAREPRVRQMGTGMLLQGLGKDGREFPVEVSLSPIHTGKESWVAAAIRDVTERMLVEQQLTAERRRAEEASRGKSNFLAAMSHEIRTPMNAILGLSDLLWETELNDEQRQYVEVFRRAGSNLLILIDDILDLSKIEAGHFELERVEFKLPEVVDQTAELIRPRARKKGIHLFTHVASEARTELIGDPARLRQVLINLLGNAIKFTEVGEVLLEVRAASSGEPGHLDFAVSDTGIGISPDKLEMIFDDFTQADSTTTRKYGGTGLGLAISRRIVELMGGRLKATSVLGKGSTFGFTAHFQASSATTQLVQEEVADFHGRRVLVVDDNPTNRLILHETLGAWGLESREFARTADALAEIAANGGPYSLVILDRKMPDIDGFEAAAQFQRTAPAIPIVMLTSEAFPGDGTRWRQAGLAGYALKPVKRAELLRIVCEAMKGPEPGAPAATRGPAEAASPNRHKAMQILLAEDSPDNRLLVKAYLKGSPHRLTVVEDGKSAVDHFAAGTFDLILMDIQMPVMDGLAATRDIRGIEHARHHGHIPIIALTAHAGLHDIEMSREAGCDAHLSKPISKQKLLEAIAHTGAPAAQVDTIDIRMPEGIEELVPGYLAERREEVAELITLLAAADFQRLATLAHNMKGTGGSFGFHDLTRIGSAMEQAARISDRDALERHLAELTEYLGRVQIVGVT